MLSGFSDPALGRKMLTNVQELLQQWTAKSGRRLVLMEVCGTHTVATFGDMMRVPGSSGNLAQARAEGADVQAVYSPLAAGDSSWL